MYFANELLSDSSLDSFTVRITEKIITHNPSAVILQLDNTKLGIDSSSAGCGVFALDGNKTWKAKKFHIENEEGTLQMVSQAIQSKLYRTLVDFEAHLDNPSADFLNASISSYVAEVM
uniref:NifU_N domain-containing protein n=1 Tax=Steinernema glaseri TaxID=37863 RepID=A0A1I8A6Z6_9BILA